jgi:hypothetical protein
VLAYLGVPHDVPSPSDVETAQNSRGHSRSSGEKSSDPEAADPGRQRFADVVAKATQASPDLAPTAAFGEESVSVPTLTGQTVRGVTELCSRLGLAPSLIGTGVAVEQFPEAGSQVLRGSQVTVRFGRPGELENISVKRGAN